MMYSKFEGKLEPSYKSEEIPEKNYGLDRSAHLCHHLTIVVGKKFDHCCG